MNTVHKRILRGLECLAGTLVGLGVAMFFGLTTVLVLERALTVLAPLNVSPWSKTAMLLMVMLGGVVLALGAPMAMWQTLKGMTDMRRRMAKDAAQRNSPEG